MHYPALCCLALLLIGVLPPTAYGGSSDAQKEFDSVLRRKANGAHGQTLFDTCAACHGTDGAGASDGTVPALAAQHFRVVVRELVSYRHENRSDERMEHFTKDHHLSGAQDIADVAAYVSRLPPTHSPDMGRPKEKKQVAETYTKQCAACHGKEGEGNNAKGYPRLAGQHREYLLDQLQEAAKDRRRHFPPTHIRLMQGINRPDLVDIADYLSHIGS
jgi:cytochrome c553